MEKKGLEGSGDVTDMEYDTEEEPRGDATDGEEEGTGEDAIDNKEEPGGIYHWREEPRKWINTQGDKSGILRTPASVQRASPASSWKERSYDFKPV